MNVLMNCSEINYVTVYAEGKKQNKKTKKKKKKKEPIYINIFKLNILEFYEII